MTFPATYNVNYYLGDTYEFNVYPKDASGKPFSLSSFDDVEFIIAARKGEQLAADPNPVIGYATISSDGSHVKCAITPTNSLGLQDLDSYVYDVRVSKTNTTTYNTIYTLLTGTLSIQERVLSVEEADIAIPDPVESIEVTAILEDSIGLSWTPAPTGGSVDTFSVYAWPYTTDYEDFESDSLRQVVEAALLTEGFLTTDPAFTITQTSSIPSQGLTSQLLQPGTAYLYMIVAINDNGISNTNGNFNLVEATISEIYTAGGS